MDQWTAVVTNCSAVPVTVTVPVPIAAATTGLAAVATPAPTPGRFGEWAAWVVQALWAKERLIGISSYGWVNGGSGLWTGAVKLRSSRTQRRLPGLPLAWVGRGLRKTGAGTGS